MLPSKIHPESEHFSLLPLIQAACTNPIMLGAPYLLIHSLTDLMNLNIIYMPMTLKSVSLVHISDLMCQFNVPNYLLDIIPWTSNWEQIATKRPPKQSGETPTETYLKSLRLKLLISSTRSTWLGWHAHTGCFILAISSKIAQSFVLYQCTLFPELSFLKSITSFLCSSLFWEIIHFSWHL